MANLFKDWNKLSRLWQGGLVPYEIDPSIDDLATDLDDELNREPRDVIENAIAHWEAETPVRFVPKTDDDEHWVVFVFDADAQNCNSGLGRKKSKRDEGHRIEFAPQGCTTGGVVHEIGHRLGLVHEHMRPDRDNHIIIHLDQLPEDWTQAKINSNFLNLAGVPYLEYDYRSVMHYGAFGSAFDPYTLNWRPGYDGAVFHRGGSRTHCLLFRRSSSVGLFCDVLANGRLAEEDDPINGVLAPRDAWLGESGWDQMRYVVSGQTTYLVGLKRDSGRVGVWNVDADGRPLGNPGSDSLSDSLDLGHPVLGFANFGGVAAYGTSREQLLFLNEADVLSLPQRQKFDYVDLLENGTFHPDPTTGSPQVWTTEIDGHWTDLIILENQVPNIWLFIDRQQKQVYWANIDYGTGALTVHLQWTVSGPAIWDKIAIRSDGNRGFYLTTYDDDGTLRQYTLEPPAIKIPGGAIASGRPGGIGSLFPRAKLEETDDGARANHTVVEMFEADDGYRLLLMRGGMGGYAEMWELTNDGLGSQIGDAVPRMERIAPVEEADRTRLGNSVLSANDKKAIDVLVRGNVEIRHTDEDRIFERIGVAFLNERISDIAAFEIGSDWLLWAGDGKSGDSWFHALDTRGKPTGRWQDPVSLKKWRTACFYQAPDGSGDTFALFRKRNGALVRRHAVTAEGVDRDELDTLDSERWDKMRTLNASDGRVFIAFVDRKSSTLAIRPVENDGGLGEPWETDVGSKLDDVALFEYDGDLYLFLVGDGGAPECHRFRPDGSRTFQMQDIGTAAGRPGLFKTWNALVSLAPDRVALYDLVDGLMGVLSGEQILGRTTVPLYGIRHYWTAFSFFVNGDGERMAIFAQDGWKWN